MMIYHLIIVYLQCILKLALGEPQVIITKKLNRSPAFYPKIYFKYIVFTIIIPNHRKKSIGKYANALGYELALVEKARDKKPVIVDK